MDTITQRRKSSPNGAGHYQVTDPYPYRVTVLIDGQEVAASVDALILKEVGTSLYDPVIYVPRKDVNLDLLQPVEDYSTHCPIKGDASYWDFASGDVSIDKAAWSYDDPLPYSDAIARHLAFDQRHATIKISPR